MPTPAFEEELLEGKPKRLCGEIDVDPRKTQSSYPYTISYNHILVYAICVQRTALRLSLLCDDGNCCMKVRTKDCAKLLL